MLLLHTASSRVCVRARTSTHVHVHAHARGCKCGTVSQWEEATGQLVAARRQSGGNWRTCEPENDANKQAEINKRTPRQSRVKKGETRSRTCGRHGKKKKKKTPRLQSRSNLGIVRALKAKTAASSGWQLYWNSREAQFLPTRLKLFFKLHGYKW